MISIKEAKRIVSRLNGSVNGQPSRFGYTCSEWWARECVRAMESGKVQPRKSLQHLEADLAAAGVYPPGGDQTAMVENGFMRLMPPDLTGVPLDQREDDLTFLEGIRLPRSVSAVMIESIRTMKARAQR